jgi:TonB family protein
METLLYLIKVNVAILLLYSFYRLLFQKDTFFQWKRIVLLSILITSLLYPFWKVSERIVPSFAFTESVFPVYSLNEFVVASGNTDLPAPVSPEANILQIPAVIYFAIGLFFLIRIIVQTITIFRIVRKTTPTGLCGSKVRIQKGLQTPFSFFGWIVLDPEKYSENELKEILLHEVTHVRQGHSFDMIFAEIMVAICWFNPFIWLLKKEIRMNLEYLADHAVLQSGCEAEHYQFHLLRLSYSKAIAKITNNFNVSPLKKRILMMNKKQTSSVSIWKYTLLIPAFALLTFFNHLLKAEIQLPAPVEDAISTATVIDKNVQDTVPVVKTKQATVRFKPPKIKYKDAVPAEETPQEETHKERKVFSHVELPPVFPGGEKALMQYLSENTKYPESAQKDSIQGRVVVRFIVSHTGKVENVEVVRSLNPACDAEAIRVVEAIPDWIPGKQNGEAVDVYYTLPILYKLQDNSVEKEK